MSLQRSDSPFAMNKGAASCGKPAQRRELGMNATRGSKFVHGR
jgi:hypothetical protein